MLEFLKTNPAFALLKKDRDTVKDLFDRFENAKARRAKKKIVDQALAELKVHATIEEEVFYPAVRTEEPCGKIVHLRQSKEDQAASNV
jgi:hemerythrin superfamily protein